MFEIGPERRPGGVGVAPKPIARPILDLLSHFRGPGFKILGGLGLEKLAGL
jgi:hypothetical protein